jgi:transposase
MQTVTTTKSSFQVYGVDANGVVVIRRHEAAFFQKLPSYLIGFEPCASSHFWARELRALGHIPRLMPPAYAKPYGKRQENDAADAEAICEAVTRATMQFVEIKTPEQQGCLMLHRTRYLFIRQQTAVINSIRTHLAEFGIVARRSAARALRNCSRTDGNSQGVPPDTVSKYSARNDGSVVRLFAT